MYVGNWIYVIWIFVSYECEGGVILYMWINVWMVFVMVKYYVLRLYEVNEIYFILIWVDFV